MFKDQHETYKKQGEAALTAVSNQSVIRLFAFIDSTLPGFRSYYLSVKDSDRENRISDFLVYFFNVCLLEEDGFVPYSFGKNPTQPESGQESDIGVTVLTKSVAPVTIVEFEAKRFSPGSNNKQYVCGDRGGMERFKRSQHGSHLAVCGMFGYIQHLDFLNAADRINAWIAELAVGNQDTTIDWTPQEERLIRESESTDITKWSSMNLRGTSSTIRLYHYLIDLSERTN